MIAHGLLSQSLRVAAIDGAYAALLGQPEAIVVGRSALDFTHPEDRAASVAIFERALDGEPLSATKRYVRPDGSAIWASIHVSRIVIDDSPQLVVSCTPLARSPAPRSSVEAQWQMARMLVRAMNSGKQAFGSGLISNPATEILLTLYLAEAEARTAMARDIAAGVTLSWPLASRWFQALLAEGYVETERGGPVDPATPMRLTPRALTMVETILADLIAAPGEVASPSH